MMRLCFSGNTASPATKLVMTSEPSTSTAMKTTDCSSMQFWKSRRISHAEVLMSLRLSAPVLCSCFFSRAGQEGH